MAVIFRTSNAAFRFNQEAVKEIINENISKYAEEAQYLLGKIDAGKEKLIEITEEPRFFDTIAIDLIARGHGEVFCKECVRKYSVTMLTKRQIGCGGNPCFNKSEVKRSKRGRFGGKRMKPIEMYGGVGYACPKGHNLISVITMKMF
jgi:hypothetical protein